MIEIKNLNKKFKKRNIYINANLKIEHNGLYALTGPSGCGKTTLFRLIKGTDKDYKGEIVRNVDDISYISQSSEIIDDISVMDFLSLFCENQSEIKTLLKEFNLADKEGLLTQKLSGGERKRLLIIVAVLSEKGLILIDEPFSGLDDENAHLIYNCLKKISQSRIIILSTHQMQDEKLYDGIIKIYKRSFNFTSSLGNKNDFQSKKKIFPKGITKYLARKSISFISILLATLSGLSLCISFFISPFCSFDEAAVLANLVVENNEFIQLDSYNGYGLMNYTTKNHLTFNCDSIIPRTTFREYSNELESSYIGFSHENQSVRVSKDILLKNNLQLGDTFNLFKKEYKVENIIENYPSTIILPSSQFDSNNLIPLQASLHRLDTIYGPFNIEFVDSDISQILIPKTINENFCNDLEFKNIYSNLSYIAYPDFMNNKYKFELGDFEDNKIIINKESAFKFITDFYSSSTVVLEYNNLSKKINEILKSQIDISTNVDDILKEYNAVQEKAESTAIGITASLFVVSLIFLFSTSLTVDKKMFVKETRFVELTNYKKEINLFHTLAHLIYLLIVIVVAFILLLVLFAFKDNPIFHMIRIMFASRHVSIIIISSLIAMIIIQLLLVRRAISKNAYKYYLKLSKSK